MGSSVFLGFIKVIAFVLWFLVTGLPATVASTLGGLATYGADTEVERLEAECRAERTGLIPIHPPWVEDVYEPWACQELEQYLSDRPKEGEDDGK